MKKIRTVIVEDDLKISELHKRFTEKVEGFEVIGIANSLPNGEEMVDVLEPELVLLDLFFPEGNGMQLLKKMREKGKSVDVILITAAKEVGSLQEALRGGAFDYLVKPVIFDRFKASLEKFRTYRTELMKNSVLEQQMIDRLIHPASEAPDEGGLPKGIDPITLRKICAVFEEEGADGYSAEDVGRKINASRNTARRYLEYLLASGFLYADIDYGTVGRPERIFRRMTI
ncbi:response regulator [Geovibrio thiophilus]|uniref:Transcriptional regulatory protein n=1 Tax=Geovibrio thiophilus TaxID=139438 RepID=A0A410JX84_9BACT|nr:response regulator [Geovibrio thiophilus]QAR32621.1 response regulator [Geovibrio thiophilus]